MNRNTVVLVLVFGILLISGCTENVTEYPTNTPSGETDFVSVKFIIEKDNENVLVKTVQIEKGKNGLEAMHESGIEFESTNYEGMGVFIDSIIGVKGDAQYYWASYVDGKYAETSLDNYLLEDDIELKWVYEKIDFLGFEWFGNKRNLKHTGRFIKAERTIIYILTLMSELGDIQWRLREQWNFWLS